MPDRHLSVKLRQKGPIPLDVEFACDPGEALPRRQAATGRGIAHVGRDGFERALDWLNGERNVGDRRREEKPLEREWQRPADQCLERLTERRSRSEGDQQVKPEYRRRQHQRNGDEGFGEQLAAEGSKRQQASEPDSKRQKNRDGSGAEPERDAEGRPVHAGYAGTEKPCFRRIARAASLWR